MKYSQWIGVLIALLVIAGCYLPWMEVPVTQKIATGMNSAGTTLGRPGKLNIIFSVIAIVCFIIPRVWAKRTNLLFCALGFAWALRNFLLYGRCEMGTCPERKYGLYLVLFGGLLMLVASLLPDTKVKTTEKKLADESPASAAKDQE
ncbi:MAG: hypothetical protein QM802_22180 [Agriterribacter sp.]